MIVKFVVDIDDGKEYSVPVACQSSWTVLRAVTALRARISLPVEAHVSVRFSDGAPVSNDCLLSSLTRQSKDQLVRVHAIVDAPCHSLSSLRLPRRVLNLSRGDSNSKKSPKASAADGSTAAVSNDDPTMPHLVTSEEDDEDSTFALQSVGNGDDDDGGKLTLVRSNVTTLGGSRERSTLPQQPIVAATSDDDDNISYSSDISEEIERLVHGIGIHTIKVNQHYRKAYATKASSLGDVIVREQPMIVVPYPQQLVEAIRSHEKLMTLSYDVNFRAPSSLNHVSDDDYAKCLSIANTHGRSVITGGRFGTQISFFPDLSACRHSCHPNAVFQQTVDRPPFEGVLRCAVKKGVEAGDEVTYLYPGADTREFVLLPRDRRDRVLRRLHYLKESDYCGCSRCWKAAHDDDEISMTGAYFVGGSNSDSSVTSSARDMCATSMRKRFESLFLVDEARGGFPMTFDDALPLIFTPPERKSEPSAFCLKRFMKVSEYAVDVLNFVTAYTRRDDNATTASRSKTSDKTSLSSSPSAEQAAALRLHKNHWRLSIARLRLLDVFSWLLDNRSDAKKAFTAEENMLQEQNESTVAERRDSKLASPVVPLSKPVFDAILDQINCEATFFPSGHPLTLRTVKMWRRLLTQLSPKLVAGVQQRSQSSLWCPRVDWETVSALERQSGSTGLRK